MELQSLSLQREDYGTFEGRFIGSLSYKNQYGKISLNLSPDLSERILAIVAEELVRSSQTVAAMLTTAVTASLPKPE